MIKIQAEEFSRGMFVEMVQEKDWERHVMIDRNDCAVHSCIILFLPVQNIAPTVLLDLFFVSLLKINSQFASSTFDYRTLFSMCASFHEFWTENLDKFSIFQPDHQNT